ncbi:PEP-CTERM sorting domain-containing protein [bacterium]|nr:MAG: PEP-CTERM sorting domain-containing protein [bacterium]
MKTSLALFALALSAVAVADDWRRPFRGSAFGIQSEIDFKYEEIWEDNGFYRTSTYKPFQNYGYDIPANEIRATFYEGGGFASSDLVDGSLHAHSWSGAPVAFTDLETGRDFTGYTEAYASSIIYDTITFTGDLGGRKVPMRLAVDGWASPGARVMAGLSIRRKGSYSYDAIRTWHAEGFHGSTTVDCDWFVPQEGVEYEFMADLTTYAYPNSFADFSHTAHFQWALPGGVGYTSASGVFTPGRIQAVPEPASIVALAIGGLAVIRRRRAKR